MSDKVSQCRPAGGSGDAVGGGGALAAATGTAEGGSEATATGQTNLYPVDYTTMSGAEFQRAVGVDPRKWAEAFTAVIDASLQGKALSDEDRIAFAEGWFRDAMDAARKDRWLPCQPVSTSS
jgi:hypothetical protein